MAEIEFDELENLQGIHGNWGTQPASDTVHVSTLDPEIGDRILRTKDVSLDTLTPDQPHPLDPPLVGRAHLVDHEVPAELMSDLADFKTELVDIEQNGLLEFPNVAWEAIKVGLAKEKFTNDKINEHVQEANKIQKDIDLLLDLQAEMNALEDSASEMTDKMRDILSELKDRGIDIWKEDGKGINKEKISQLKSLTSSQVDKLRSNLQILFTTKIQVMIQTIGAIMETLKDINRNHIQLMNKISSRMTPGR